MKRASTLFLKAVLVVIGGIVLVGSVWSFPYAWVGATTDLPDFTHILYPGLIGIYAAMFPFLFALVQAFMLLQYIDKNRAFSDMSVKALKIIKYCAVAMSALYMIAMPLAYIIAELDDAPGLIIISFAFACAPLVVATFAAVLQKLIQNALDMKREHDLTV